MKLSTSTFLRRAGFTIVELVMATAVGGVVISASIAGFVTMQRSGVIYMASSEARANQVRLVEALQRDLRNATSYTLGTGGALPFTMVLPGRYSEYEAGGNRAGEPKHGSDAIRQKVKVDFRTGKAVTDTTATVRFFATTEPRRRVVHREVTWTEGGALKTASRPVAQLAQGATVNIAEIVEPIPQSTKTVVRSAVITVRSAAETQRNGRTPSTFAMSETVFLRGKVYTR